MSAEQATALLEALRQEAQRQGFQALGVAGIELGEDAQHLLHWLEQGRHGEMDYMARHGSKRFRPDELVPGTLRVISLRMDYWPDDAAAPWAVMADTRSAYVSRYALGRDYHKVLRQRMQALCDWLQRQIGDFGYRVFTDSAPVLEKALARNAGLGWIGKHSNLIDKRSGSYFFLGEIYTTLELPIDQPASNHCGTCTRCLSACPTAAIVAPYQVDARRCISYLTIEYDGIIDPALADAMGNRIYGCDDCQLVCPWNKFARISAESDFRVRHQLDRPDLLALFAWSEAEFLAHTEGSAIRRIGWRRWQRNIAIALGNGPADPSVITALRDRLSQPLDDVLRTHIERALARYRQSDDSRT
ncbi:tRNA epoxyqueuosine(34) reductase QueG [Pseudoxanthomonas sp. CAU 1598]|uniref:Epoxyqueuosine reductase n=1 Tax=Pseudomarimonas arenosa TaxID=2774145 RepID=A0AAW3ZNP7_9GAMM|nr:tRNA epoxyqueuosine(34) reductase QueG [Pseudomarimonas arenosa]